jgi:hypothetical protein
VLGPVHGDVRPLDELVDVPTVVGEQRDAEAAADGQREAVDHARRLHDVAQPLDEAGRLVQVDAVPQEHGELVAAQPGDDIV